MLTDPIEQSGPVIGGVQFSTQQELLDRLQRGREIGATLLDRLRAKKQRGLHADSSLPLDVNASIARIKARSAAEYGEFERQCWERFKPAAEVVGSDAPEPIWRKRTRSHKPTLASVVKQVAKAGLEVARYEVDPDGRIIVVTGKADDVMMTNTEIGNEWDRLQ